MARERERTRTAAVTTRSELGFGVLKFFPTLSPAEDLAGRTIAALTFGAITPAVSVPVLATWECAIGVGLIRAQCLRATLLLMFVHMTGTITPLFLFPHETWARLLSGSGPGRVIARTAASPGSAYRG